MNFRIENDDVINWSKRYDGEPFHALLTDPPYHLTTITKRFGKKNSAPAKKGRDGAFGRVSRGFMGEEWDGGDISFRPETWFALKRHLYDGAFGVAYGGSRTYHRVATAIEDAGFVIHPNIFAWIYGTGLAKPTRIDNQIRRDDSIDADPETWETHRYGLGALKPAAEPIIVFQKPYNGRPVENITQTGAGALNIDAAGIHAEDGFSKNWNRRQSKTMKDDRPTYGKYEDVDLRPYARDERYPSNSIISHSPLCTPAACVPDCATTYLGDKSIFYFNADYFLEQTETANPFFYYLKPSTEEKDAGLEDFPDIPKTNGRKNPHPSIKSISLNRYLATLLLPPDAYSPRRVLIPFSGTGSEMIGALLAGFDFVAGVEKSSRYTSISYSRIKYHITRESVESTPEIFNRQERLNI